MWQNIVPMLLLSCGNLFLSSPHKLIMEMCLLGQDLTGGKTMPLTPSASGSPPNPLPTNEQQRAPSGHAIAPAVAGRTPSKSSAPIICTNSSLWLLSFANLLPLLLPLLDRLICTLWVAYWSYLVHLILIFIVLHVNLFLLCSLWIWFKLHDLYI